MHISRNAYFNKESRMSEGKKYARVRTEGQRKQQGNAVHVPASREEANGSKNPSKFRTRAPWPEANDGIQAYATSPWRTKPFRINMCEH